MMVNLLTATLGLTVVAGYLFGYAPEDKDFALNNGRAFLELSRHSLAGRRHAAK